MITNSCENIIILRPLCLLSLLVFLSIFPLPYHRAPSFLSVVAQAVVVSNVEESDLKASPTKKQKLSTYSSVMGRLSASSRYLTVANHYINAYCSLSNSMTV